MDSPSWYFLGARFTTHSKIERHIMRRRRCGDRCNVHSVIFSQFAFFIFSLLISNAEKRPSRFAKSPLSRKYRKYTYRMISLFLRRDEKVGSCKVHHSFGWKLEACRRESKEVGRRSKRKRLTHPPHPRFRRPAQPWRPRGRLWACDL